MVSSLSKMESTKGIDLGENSDVFYLEHTDIEILDIPGEYV